MSRDKLIILYKTVLLSKILYCCSVWAGATTKKTIAKLLISTQRKSALNIAQLFKTTSADAANVLAGILPLDLKVKEIVLGRLLAPMGSLLPRSSHLLVSALKEEIVVLQPPSNVSLSSFRKRLLNQISAREWNERWASFNSGSVTRSFFPLASESTLLFESRVPHTAMELLSGHSVLNRFLFKIGKVESPLCACQSQEEDTSHFLFFCPLFERKRQPLQSTILELGTAWPPPLSASQVLVALEPFPKIYQKYR